MSQFPTSAPEACPEGEKTSAGAGFGFWGWRGWRGWRRWGLVRLVAGLAVVGGVGVAGVSGETAGALGSEGVAEAAVDFNRDVRPILSENCFFCHGPDENERKGGPRGKGGVRLDTLEGQRMDLGGYAAVVPGDPEASGLIRRLVTADEDELMPPRESGKRLKPEQVEILRRWVASGAKFSNHWSYEPPVRPAVPAVRDGGWGRNPIDRFVQARLEQEGLVPRAEAGRRVLARRAALDLTGLPPTPEEVRVFLEDPDEGAFERYVDRLLGKAAFGEHWARMWLDLARYADSAGYADDPPRTIWPYRDYVIRAFNANLPFDRFTEEQLAGDLLPGATEEQIKATAFHRNTMTNSEGGTSDEEFRNVAVVDRVNTTFAVWMGTSMACAQCHSHKYDPITQKEYFELFAFFNNTADADRPDEAPLFEFDSEEVRAKRAALTSEIAALDAAFEAARDGSEQAALQWAKLFPTDLRWQTPRPSGFTAKSGAGHRLFEDGSLRVEPKATNASSDTYTVELPYDTAAVLTGLRLEALADSTLEGGGPGLSGGFVVRQVRARILPVPNQAGPMARYVRIEKARAGGLGLVEVQAFSGGENVAIAGTAVQSGTRDGGLAGNAVDGRTEVAEGGGGGGFALTTEEAGAWWEVDLGRERAVERIVVWGRGPGGEGLEGLQVAVLDAERRRIWDDAGARPAKGKQEWALDLTGPRDVVFANASADGNGDRLDERLVATDAPRSVRYRKAGERGWGGSGAVGKDGVLYLATVRAMEVPRGATLEVTLVQESQGGGKGSALGRFRLGVTGEARAAEYVDTPAAVRAVLAAGVPGSDAAGRALVVEHFVREVAPGLRAERDRYAAVLRERDELKPLTVPVMRELKDGERRATRIQLRGNFLVTGDEVTEGVPAVWPPLPEGAPRNRLTLARWLMSDANPLTARVLANRFWEQIFGHGIVRTSEEFGSQGELPVNAELLDWLACELREGGWDVKRFLRLLVTSATYRQSSQVTPEALEKDPENRLNSRGPRFRMGAEMVRDQALAAAGLLSAKLHGPSVRPPRPNLDLRAAFGGNLDWQPSAGEDRYRRGLYTEWRRTSPYPSMATFDAPSREVCTLRRSRSNTPLQALVTLNDPVYVEAAQALARRMVAGGSDFEARLAHGFERVLARGPSAAEAAELGALFREVRAVFAEHPERAAAMAGLAAGAGAGVGAASAADPEGAADLAAWTTVGNVLLNLDETLMKR